MNKISDSLVTVIIPAYNHEKYIEECLSSVINQTYQNLQIIVIDDGSKDNTKKVIEAFIENQETLIEFISKNNEGICKTFNMGIGLARGKYIAFIASDDKWLPNRIEEQVLYMEKNENIGFVFSDAYFMRDNKITNFKYSDYKPSIKKYFLNSKNTVNAYELMLVENLVPALTVLIKKECFDEVGLFDESLKYEDYDMWLRVSKKYPLGYIHKPLAYYRIHDNNVSNNTNQILKAALRALYKQYRSYPLRNKPFKIMRLFLKFSFTALKNKASKTINIKKDS